MATPPKHRAGTRHTASAPAKPCYGGHRLYRWPYTRGIPASTCPHGQLFEIADLPFLLAPIASAIDYAHQHGIIHNALSPSNILLDRLSPLNNLPGTPLLIGFCNSYLYPTQDIPRESVPYVSPELAQGHMENARSDIYSLGVILYELCTGTLPFHGDTTADITAQHVHSTPISPALINPNLPPALTAVIMRALSRDPLARFPTATSLVVAIARALNMPAHDILDQISSSPGSPSSTPWQDSMHSPTYLSFPQMTPAKVAALTPQQPGFTPQPSYTTVQARAPVPTTPPPPTLELQHAPPIPQAPGQRPAYKRKRSQLLVALLILVALLGASLGGFLLLRNTFTAAPAVVGHAFFASSGQINLNTDVGIADQLRINLDGLPDPPTGQSYFFWLLSENNAEKLPVSLGQSTHGGHIDITYDKNSRHENLLANYSRLLVTLENIDPTPTNPATDTASWRYYAEFSTQKTGQFSQLDHLRHLLAKDPKLQQLSTPLNGGLDIWLFRNTLKVLEFAGSARDAQASGDIGLVQRQLVRILDYLDGAQYVQTEKLPAGLPYMLIDPVIAQVALL
ncbi:MAG: protein kinase, partial [Ktedonobacteraceae bacterium]|nr:protein kinase [Ktedonobacteraceae bacterium]